MAEHELVEACRDSPDRFLSKKRDLIAMTLLQCASIGLMTDLGAMTGVWLLSLKLRDASIVDRVWGLGFVLLALVYTMLQETFLPRAFLILALTAIWGLRLSWHIHRRNKGKPEDYRYQEMRKKAGPSFASRSLVRVFWLQGFMMWLISLPLLFAVTAPEMPIRILDILGVGFWAIGFLFEALGDAQLRRFKMIQDNQGKIMDKGLWSLTRHPNYFGDACIWFGFFCIGAAATLPLGLLGIISPLLMTFFLVNVSGVALLEKTMSQKPGYLEYMAATPAFFPKISKLWRQQEAPNRAP